MFIANARRIIKWGFVNFLRNGIVSFSSVLVMIIALAMIVSTLLITAFLNSTLQDLESKIDINVYLSTEAAEEDILKLKSELEAFQGVKAVEYVSKQTALDEFRLRHQEDQLTIQALDELGTNPLRPRLNVQAISTEQYANINKYLTSDPALSSAYPPGFIDKVNYTDNRLVIEKMGTIINGVRNVGFLVTLVLIAISVLITFNTIRLAIYISREEISVMRLVGASNTFVRGPFIIEGILYGIVAALITISAFYPITLSIKRNTEDLYGGIDLFKYYVTNFEQIFIIVVLSGVGLGVVSSYLAVRRYLKK